MNTNSNTTNRFIEGLKGELDSKTMFTENGALAYQTAGGEGKCLVDFNFAISAMRGWDETKIADAYAKAYYENPEVALRYWAFCADCRGGLGERRTSRIIFNWLVKNQLETAKKLVTLIPEYGRWDSLVMLVDSPLRDDVVNIIAEQLRSDLVACRAGKSFSLLAKWIASENTSSPKTRKLASTIRKGLDMTPKQYRKMLSELRKGLKIVERSISSGNWSEVDYNAVPSKANVLYRNAFMKHDTERRNKYLELLKSGDKTVKINSSQSFPCDLVHQYEKGGWYDHIAEYDETIEQMWKSLPDYVNGRGNNVLVVADTSGSMNCQIGGSKTTAWAVAQSLAIYFSQRASGPFKDKYIMFSANPFWVDFSNCATLHDRLVLSAKYNECSNTDIAKTFDLILDTAVNNNLSQDEIPSTILIVSDMQFDMSYSYDKVLMEKVKERFERAGYRLPKIVAWNTVGGYGRTTPVPIQQNDEGVILMSGFSASLMQMALSGEVSPYKALLEQLNKERYSAVSEAVSKS